MAHRGIGQERFGFSAQSRSSSSLDDLSGLIDWGPVTALLEPLYPANKGEPAWPPLAMFKALLLAVWYDLSDVKLAEALDDRASFRRFCGFSANEATPERTAFVRYRRLLVARGLNQPLFEAVTAQLKAKAMTVKAGTLVDATIIASASEGDDEGRWVKHKGKVAVHGFKAGLSGFPCVGGHNGREGDPVCRDGESLRFRMICWTGCWLAALPARHLSRADYWIR